MKLPVVPPSKSDAMAPVRFATTASDARMQAVLHLLFVSLGVLVMATGCRRSTVDVPATGASGTSATPVANDTIRGVIRRVGNDPMSVLVLESRNGALHSLRGSMLELLGRAVGLDIMAQGTDTDQLDRSASPRGALIFEVKAFAVRAADGQVATDGILKQQAGKYLLVTMSGAQISVPFLPKELQNKLGARVFLVGPLDRIPSAYGILAEAR